MAKKRYSYNIEGLITGATFLQSKQLIVLCGYSELLEPFIYLLYDFSGTDFFRGNKRKVNLSLPFHQVEGITTTNGLKYYLSNEFFSVPPYLTVPQKLHILNLEPFLEDYLESFSSDVNDTGRNDAYTVYPVPAEISVKLKRSDYKEPEKYFLINNTGRILRTGIVAAEEDQIDISSLSCGLYILKIGNNNCKHFKIIRK